MTHKEQYACMLVREFPAQAIVRMRQELCDTPFVLLEGEPPLETVLSLNTKARLLGIRHGMTRVEVETFEGAVCIARSMASETTARAALVECASCFSPRIEVHEEAKALLICLDVTGTELLFGSAESLAKSLRNRCASLGISVQVVVSGNFHASILLAKGLPARLGVSVVGNGHEVSALAPLPLFVLGLPEGQADTFSLWGIRTLGMLAALPQGQLISRLGQDGKRLQQLATGTLPHLFQPTEVPFTLEEYAELDDSLDNLESLLFGLAIMLDHLIVQASLRVYALATITIDLKLEGGASHHRTVSPRVPTNDKHLWLKLLRLDLEAHPAPAPVVAVRMQAQPGSESKVQLGLFSPQLPEPGRLDVTLARIAAIVGENNVGLAVLDDAHAPGSFHMEPFVLPTNDTHTQPVAAQRGSVRRIVPPQVTMMELRTGRPSRFSHRGQRYRVTQSYGPWLLGGEWWSKRTWGQEQWDLIARSDDDAMLCCCVLRDFVRNEWRVAGLYD
jgi:protein ImuB